ncbi:MAG: hypothetical protein FWG44_06010 [Oscillospiraceae bacterium]|nr:hypothetical protein [Oscillospiraceae bacterium]
MNTVEEIKKTQDYVVQTVNGMFDDLIRKAENPNSEEKTADTELKIPLSTRPAVFVGTKPIALLFGDERIAVKSWRDVYREIITRCYESPEHCEMLMYLRDKAHGKIRTFISASPVGMTRPLKIADDVYCEVHYGTETLMHILVNQILAPARYDVSGICVC